MKYLSLFSGIGGFELGIEQAYENLQETIRETSTRYSDKPTWNLSDTFCLAGELSSTENSLECIGFSEIDKYATQIYQKHFPEHKNYGDIKTINTAELPDFDLLVGGFPCQAFSIAGKRDGFNDTRGTLFFEIARILKAKSPRVFLLENVKGLLSHDNGQTFRTIIATLDELGYDLQWQVLNSKNFGVPQNRERVFIVGHIRGTSRPKVFPVGGETETNAGNAFYDESQWRREGKLREYHGISPTLNTAQGGGKIPLVANTLDANYHKGNSATKDRHTPRTQIEHNSRIRRLTPIECERLQGFPDGWTEGVSDTQRYKCLGNAVTVNVIQEIIKRLI